MTTSIYNTSSLRNKVVDSSTLIKQEAAKQLTKKRTKNLNHDGWNLWDIHPHWNPKSFSLSLSGSEEMYHWVQPKCPYVATYTNRYGEEVTKGSPYNYHRLLGSVCPQFFGIYQDNMQIIQVQLHKLRTNRVFKLRTLSISQLNSFLYHQMNVVSPKVRGYSALQKVFSSEMWQQERHHRHFLHISEHDIERFLPTLPKFNDQISIWELLPSTNPDNPRFRWCESLYQFDEYEGEDIIHYDFKEAMFNIMGQETPADEFRSMVEEFGLTPDIRPLNKILAEEGMKVVKTRRKVKGKVLTFYAILGIRVTSNSSPQPYFYPKERIPLA